MVLAFTVFFQLNVNQATWLFVALCLDRGLNSNYCLFSFLLSTATSILYFLYIAYIYSCCFFGFFLFLSYCIVRSMEINGSCPYKRSRPAYFFSRIIPSAHTCSKMTELQRLTSCGNRRRIFVSGESDPLWWSVQPAIETQIHLRQSNMSRTRWDICCLAVSSEILKLQWTSLHKSWTKSTTGPAERQLEYVGFTRD